MCLSPSAYVECRTYERLRARGVSHARAAGVARKVARAYRAKHPTASGERSDGPTVAVTSGT